MPHPAAESLLFQPMDKDSNTAITAIADVAQESFIATLLAKLGFRIIYRATSAGGLSSMLSDNPNVLLVASDDFRNISEIKVGDLLIIRGKSAASSHLSQLNPQSESEFFDLVQERKRTARGEINRPIRSTSDVTLFFSTANARGATVTAINFAHELANRGESVLLIDANFAHPDLSERFNFSGLFKRAQPTNYGFTLCELASLESLNNFSQLANAFNQVVIDLGSFQERYLIESGRRWEEYAYSWALQSAKQVFLLSSEPTLHQSTKAHERIIATNAAIDCSLVFTLDRILSTRERARFTSQISKQSGLSSHLISRDIKAIDKMERENSTVLASSPKSLLRSEIAALASGLSHG